MSAAERFIEAATAPLAEKNAELHLAAQQELREQIDASDEAAINTATAQLKNAKGACWIPVLLIVMGIVSLPIIVSGVLDYRSYLLGTRIINNDYGYEEPPVTKTLTPDEKLLLNGDTRQSSRVKRWKALWDSRPEEPSYFVEYAIHHIAENKTTPPDFLKTANEIDPDNGWYWAMAAGLECEDIYTKGSLSRTAREERKDLPLTIDDLAKHQAAISLLEEAMSKPRFTSYDERLLKQRIPLLPPRTDYVTQFPAFAYLAASPFRNKSAIPIADCVSAEAQRCGSESDETGYLRIRDLNKRYITRLARDGCSLVDVLIANSTASKTLKSLRDSAATLGRDQESELLRELDIDHFPTSSERKAKRMEESEEITLVERRGSILSALMIPSVHQFSDKQVPLTIDDLTPGRLAEHALFGRLASACIWLILGVALSAVTLYRFRHDQVSNELSQRLRDLLKASDWSWIIIGGCFAPVFWFILVAQLSPLAAHHWNMRASSFIQPSGQFTATGWLMLVTPICIARWRLSKHAPFLGMKVRHPWLAWLAVASLVLAIPTIGTITHDWAKGLSLMHAATAMIALGQIWLLVVVIRAIFGERDRGLHRQTVARTLIPAYACGMILAVLSIPVFHHFEKKWILQDHLMEISAEEPSLSRYEYRVTQHLKSELLETMSRFPGI